MYGNKRKVAKKVVIYSYYSPEELTGIGKYNGEMINWLIKNGVEVLSFSNAPFYPYWEVYDQHKNPFFSVQKKNFVDVRSYVYVPKAPGTLKKIISEISYIFSSAFALLLKLKQISTSNLFVVVNPPFFLGIIPLIIGKVVKTKVLFHIQDLQVDAARELGLLPKVVCSFLEKIEVFFLKRANYISTISPGMKKKILNKGLNTDVLMIPNWSDLVEIKPQINKKWLHQYLDLDEKLKLIVYSGNLGEKQGLEIVLQAAKQLESHQHLHFVILGAGLYKQSLISVAESMSINNLTFGNLVPKQSLIDMLASSYLQLVIQKSVGADSFLPSKLTNILASGSACIITAEENTSLYELMYSSKAAKLVAPDSYEALVQSIMELEKNVDQYKMIKLNARKWAEQNLDINNCLQPLLNSI